MKRVLKILFVVLACTAGIIGPMEPAQSANPKEVELIGSKLTHMDRSPSEHVMLEENLVTPPQSCIAGVIRIFPDGSKDPSSFVVPAGKVLIITDIEAVIAEDFAWSPGDVVSLKVIVKGPSNQEARILNAFGVVSSESASSGVIAINSHSQSGGIAGPETTVCLEAFFIVSNGGGIASLRRAHLNGYLIDE